ncbi:hypothetical protein DFQ28_005367 [Apophysomyces sp. BC1034]|nr:hypothetical protein DFQ30_005326 [Apophysomyces sp. BC1015]KAG0188113.1 hypothetical protein DFQ28_005367 [Apophysomyces sp. BC1034]
MPSFLGSKSNKRKSWTPANSENRPSSNLLSRLPANSSTPTVHHQYSNNVVLQPQVSRSSEYLGPASPPPYDTMLQTSPVPTPSTSWTSDVSAFVDRLRDDAASIVGTNKGQQQQMANLDRRSISQGIKLVAIAADEYDDGNDSVALDIYLSGIDKILMALPNKTDSKTKLALREKLQSVEERVGILHLASQHQQKHLTTQDEQEQPKSSLINSVVARIANTYKTTGSEQESLPPSSPPITSADPIYRFKSFGQFIIDCIVACAVLIKQSPLPDILFFVFGYLLQLFIWIDGQYHIIHKIQDFGFECVKLMLQADEQYRLHEFASEAMYMFVAAGLKAAVAYKETPGYHQQEQIRQQRGMLQPSHESPQIEYYNELPARESRTTWPWSRWQRP